MKPVRIAIIGELWDFEALVLFLHATYNRATRTAIKGDTTLVHADRGDRIMGMNLDDAWQLQVGPKWDRIYRDAQWVIRRSV